ncbi:MAG: DUF1761 domain-containing protein [Chlorobi bacterium]|nr:DUF1761 domain-containing protein [Chlorobiota bacterium]MCI0716967.1 DUF1761 domain-containing protein [Chlorobiota bacterium]
MPDTTINLIPVVIAGVINMLLGALWYSPYVMGKLWMKSMGKTEEEIKQGYSGASMGLVYVVNTIASLLFSYVLAHIVKFASLTTFGEGANAGFWVWLGFVVTTVLPGYLYENRPKMLYFIFIIYQLISIVLMGGVLAMWQSL